MARKIKFGDREITVPDDTTDQEISAIIDAKPAATKGFENLQGAAPNEYKPAPYPANLAVNSLPAVGSMAGPGGTMIGTGIKMILRKNWPGVFGQNPSGEDLGGTASEAGKDLLVNDVVPSAIGKGVGAAVRLATSGPKASAAVALKNMPGVRQGAAQEMSRQIMEQFGQPESQILDRSANKATNFYGTGEYQPITIKPGSDYVPQSKTTNFQPATRPETMPNGPIKIQTGENEIGQKLARLDKALTSPSEVTRTQVYKEIGDLATSDPIYARHFKAAAGAENFDDLAINKLLKIKDKGGINLDTSKILSTTNNEIYKEVTPETLSNFKNLIGEIDSQQSGHSISDGLIKVSKGRLLWTGVGLGSIFGLHPAGIGVGATAAGITLTNSMLSRAMSNPETARIVVEAMRTPATSQKGQIINHILGTLWKGAAAVGETEQERQQ